MTAQLGRFLILASVLAYALYGDRALANLQWYRMASGDEYNCIVIERGVRRPGYVAALKSIYANCRVQLGKESKLCFSQPRTPHGASACWPPSRSERFVDSTDNAAR